MTQVAELDDGVSELARAWARVRANLRRSAGARVFDQWLAPVTLASEDDTVDVRLTLPTAFATNWVKSHYADRLLHEFRAVLPGVRSVAIDTATRAGGPVVLTAPVPAAPVAPVPLAAPVISAAVSERPSLDPRLTFERFVVDASNMVALNAAQALAAPGVVRFSPLFIHGGTGQGKTHLMNAIAHRFLADHPQARVMLMSAERFMFEFVAAMRARDTFAFKAKLRSCDLLLIDDLQFIAGKDVTQDEFFHTVNEIMAAGKRLVIAADRAPQALDGIEPRILGRLGSGLVVDIRPSSLELRRTILTRRVAEMPDVRVPEAVLDLLAERISSSIRELEGALTRVTAYAMLTGQTIDLEFATQTLGDMLRGHQRRVTIDQIQKLVCDHFELKPLDLLSARRARAVARPRQIAMYLAKRLTTRSLPEIGRKFGGRDHSTVIHAVRRIEALRDSDREVDQAVHMLLGQLGA
ncbi:chromosomal replication initiator protein DnaA [Sphingomonas sp. 8AM]|uniref:chromosomal replication initiator protein DnaA n=1 Tax=Sphingomonas sp. 8AM TaxID=2653170 RepID=UPI0012F0E42A|nr:chromosomal replication initiator protein DnaA [Sphingomonas sp. 8AM]VXD03007.1 Chromosomal replication initiator protein DnaA [Sphingomonas sp. 8AM]